MAGHCTLYKVHLNPDPWHPALGDNLAALSFISITAPPGRSTDRFLRTLPVSGPTDLGRVIKKKKTVQSRSEPKL